MKRIIKFRAWDNIDKEMHTDVSTLFDNGKVQLWKERKPGTRKILHDCVVMQYSGFWDDNGNEIFDGDILVSETDATLLVRFNEKQGCWDAEYECNVWDDEDLDVTLITTSDLLINCLDAKAKYLIAGNIYQNPELFMH